MMQDVEDEAMGDRGKKEGGRMRLMIQPGKADGKEMDVERKAAHKRR
jgi:hypothetical protein